MEKEEWRTGQHLHSGFQEAWDTDLTVRASGVDFKVVHESEGENQIPLRGAVIS